MAEKSLWLQMITKTMSSKNDSYSNQKQSQYKHAQIKFDTKNRFESLGEQNQHRVVPNEPPTDTITLTDILILSRCYYKSSILWEKILSTAYIQILDLMYFLFFYHLPFLTGFLCFRYLGLISYWLRETAFFSIIYSQIFKYTKVFIILQR